jgi:hypothetical protein
MKRLIALATLVAMVVAFTPWVAAAADKTAKGTVSAVAGDSVTVKVDGTDMVFKVDSKTKVVGKGGTTATREAQMKGDAGPKLSDVVKTGDQVEVKYAEAAGVMTATDIRVTMKAMK